MSKIILRPKIHEYLAFFIDPRSWQTYPLFGNPNLEVEFSFKTFLNFVSGNLNYINSKHLNLNSTQLFLTMLRESQIQIAVAEGKDACLLSIEGDVPVIENPLTQEAKLYSGATRTDVIERVSYFRNLQDMGVKIPLV